MSTVVQEALDHFSGITECYIRIYGGWYQNGILTGRGSEIMQKFSSICPIPDVFAGRSVLGNVTFVEQIYGVDAQYSTERDGAVVIVKGSNNEGKFDFMINTLTFEIKEL